MVHHKNTNDRLMRTNINDNIRNNIQNILHTHQVPDNMETDNMGTDNMTYDHVGGLDSISSIYSPISYTSAGYVSSGYTPIGYASTGLGSIFSPYTSDTYNAGTYYANDLNAISPLSVYTPINVNSSNYPHYHYPVAPRKSKDLLKQIYNSNKPLDLGYVKNHMNQVPTLNLQYSHPMYSSYQNISADKSTQKRTVKEIKQKLLKKWIPRDYPVLLGYLKNGPQGVELVNDINKPTDYKSDKTIDMKLKLEFLDRNFLQSDRLRKYVKDYAKQTNKEWIQVLKNKSKLKEMLLNRIATDIKYAIENKK